MADHSVATRQSGAAIDPVLLRLYRGATPGQKLAAVDRINRTLQTLKQAQLAKEQPHLTLEEQRRALRSWWFSARD